MAKKCCDYKDCRNIRQTYGNIAFFSLPNDERRSLWIENSGNTLKSVRFICEEHFEKKYLIRQFTRTRLSKSAVPIKYKSNFVQNLKPKDFNSELHTSFNTTLNQNCEIFPEDLNYDIEYCDDDSYDESLNFIEISCDVNSSGSRNSPVFNEENVVEVDAEIINGICPQEVLEYSEKHEEIQPVKSFCLKIKKRFENSCEPSLKKVKQVPLCAQPCYQNQKYSDTNISCSKSIENIKNEKIDLHNSNIRGKTNFESIVIDESGKNATNGKTNENQDFTINEHNFPHMTDEYEEDKFFLLSLVGNFQRLPLQKKMLAKVKILRYLMDLEFSNGDCLNI